MRSNHQRKLKSLSAGMFGESGRIQINDQSEFLLFLCFYAFLMFSFSDLMVQFIYLLEAYNKMQHMNSVGINFKFIQIYVWQNDFETEFTTYINQ